MADLGTDQQLQNFNKFLHSLVAPGPAAVPTQNDAEAVKWFHKAAEQGNATAQYNLGRMYQNGEGVTRDFAEARRWYQKAAAQGHEDAKVLLEGL